MATRRTSHQKEGRKVTPPGSRFGNKRLSFVATRGTSHQKEGRKVTPPGSRFRNKRLSFVARRRTKPLGSE